MTKETVLAMEHFSRVSNVYNGVRTTDPEPVCFIQQHLDHLDRIAGAEVGAGGGRYSWLLLQAIPGLHLTCSDLNESMLEEAGRFLQSQNAKNYELALANSSALPFEEDSLDCLMTFNAVHHFDLIRFLKETGRVLKENGQLFIYTRTQTQNAVNIWGKYFPGFARMETRLHSFDQLDAAIRSVPSLELDSIQVFRYERCASRERLLEQARSGHYSTFSLYGGEHFKQALSQFEENLSREFPDPAKITWTAENTMQVVRSTG